MRIIFLNRYFFPDHSATSQMLSELAFYLAESGHSVAVITSRQRYDDAAALLPASERIRGVEVHRVRTTRFGRAHLPGRAADYASFYLTAGWRLWRLARGRDVIVAKTDPPLIAVVAWLIARLRGATLVNWLQDVFPEVAERLRLPLLAGPVSVFVCIEQGPDFARHAAGSTLLGMWSSCAFCLAYHAFAKNRLRLTGRCVDGACELHTKPRGLSANPR